MPTLFGRAVVIAHCQQTRPLVAERFVYLLQRETSTVWVPVAPLMLSLPLTYHLYPSSRCSSSTHLPSPFMVSPHFNSVRMGHVILWSMADVWWSASGHRLHKSMSHFRLTIARIG